MDAITPYPGNGDPARRRIGIWHPGLTTNQGDRAIQRAVIDLLQRQFPGATICQFHADEAQGRSVYPEAYNEFIRGGWRRLGEQLRGIRSLDLLVWGGGSLVQQSSLLYLPHQLIPVLVARGYGVPVVCFGSGVEPLQNRLLRRLTRVVFQRSFAAVLVRGRRSADTLRELGVTRPIRVAVDPVASLEPAPPEGAAELALRELGFDPRQRPAISVAFKRCFIYRGGLLPVSWEGRRHSGWRFERHRLVESAFIRLIHLVVDTYDVDVVLLAMFHGQGDVEFSRRLLAGADRPGRVHLLASIPSSRVLKALVGLMQAHVGVRLHSTILATSMGVPSLGVYYMQKGLEYFELLGEERYALSLDEVDFEGLRGAFCHLWEHRSEIRDRLLRRNRELVADLVEEAAILQRVLADRQPVRHST